MDEHTPDDPLPLLRAELDQMLALAPELARVARGYFDVFKAEDFSDSQALYLTAVQLKDSPGKAP